MANKTFSATTLTVYEEVLKLVSAPPHYFYPRDIIDELGISRQHVTNLLSRLVGLGLLERKSAKYTCPPGQLPTLIEYVIGASKYTDNPSTRLTKVEGIFSQVDVNELKSIGNAVLKAQSLGVPNYPTLKQNWIDRLEQAQAAIKKELKYIKGHATTSANVDEELFNTVVASLLGDKNE